jgi:hypothetical protein
MPLGLVPIAMAGALLVPGVGPAAGWTAYLTPVAAIVLFLVWAAGHLVPSPAGLIELSERGRLAIRAGRLRRELDVRRSQWSLARCLVHPSLPMVQGTVCELKDAAGGRPLRVLGSQVELEAAAYDAPEVDPSGCDAVMDAAAFRDFLDAIRASAPGGWARADDGFATRFPGPGERRFAATPLGGRLLVPMAAWMGGAAAAGGAGALVHTLVGPSGPRWLVPAVVTGGVLLALAASVIVGTRRWGRRGAIVMDAAGLRIEVDGRVVRAVRPPFGRLEVGSMEQQTRYRDWYTGPAVDLTDTRGRRVRIAIADPGRRWAGPAPTVRSAGFQVGADAGTALVRWLRAAGAQMPPLE